MRIAHVSRAFLRVLSRASALGVAVATLVAGTSAIGLSQEPRPEAPRTGPSDVAPTAEIARVPVTVVQGRLVVACQLGAKKRIACNLFVDLDGPYGLLLHNKAADGIVAENDDGTPNAITIYLPDVNLTVARREVGDEKTYDDFTKWWSKELGENAVVGSIGAKLLARHHLTLDLPAGFLEISAPHAREPESSVPTSSPAGTFVAPATIVNDLVWVKVGYGAQRSAALGLATSRHDTWIDADLCDEAGHPAGDVGPARLGPFDLATFVAFRPEEVRHTHPDGVFGLTGVNLLASFRVEIDRVNGRVTWTQAREARFPTADLEYFRARVDGRAEALEAWLAAHPDERLAGEASERLLAQLVREGGDAARVKSAMERRQHAAPEDLQATCALDLVRAMLSAGRPDLALVAGELGVAGGRKDRYPDAIHKIHARMGDVLLDAGRREEAWKHLLSAAFGLPEDGPLNLSLARYYEAEGRFSRAFSRYLVALLSADSGPQAIEGLQRVQDKVPDAEAFSVDSIERLIAGRVQNFGVASRYEPKEGRESTRAVLAELYTNAHSRGEIGVTLARDGLRDFFLPENLVLVTYHVPEPEVDPLVNRLSLAQWSRYGEEAEAAHWIDGVVEAPPAGLVRHKDEIFERTKGAVISRLDEETPYTITIGATIDRDGLRGQAEVRGPEAQDAVVQVLLVERGVLFPGKSKVVVHHHVARAALTASPAGEPFAPKDGVALVPFERTWTSLADDAEAFLTEREARGGAKVPRFSTRIDPRQARVVVILRERDGGAVLQCAQLDPTLPEDMR